MFLETNGLWVREELLLGEASGQPLDYAPFHVREPTATDDPKQAGGGRVGGGPGGGGRALIRSSL